MTIRSSARSRLRPQTTWRRPSPSAKAALKTPAAAVEAGRDPRQGSPLLAERRDEFATIIAKEAAKPIKTARVEAERAVGTFQFAAAEARKLAGEMVAARRDRRRARASSASRCACRSVSSARSPRSTSRSTSSPTSSPRRSPPAARWCSSRRARRRSARSRLAKMLIDECGLPAEYLHVVTGGGGTVGNAHRRPSRHRPHHVHRIARRRLGRSAPGRRASGSGSSSATTRRSSSSPTATGRPPPPRSRWPASATPARAASRTQRIFVHSSIADDFTAALVEHVDVAGRRRPARRSNRRLGADLHGRARPGRVVGRRGRVAGGAKVLDGRRTRRRRRTAADRHHRRQAGHEGVLARGVRTRRGDRRPTTTSTTRSSWPTTPRSGLQAAIFTADIGKALRGDPHARLRRRAGQRGADLAAPTSSPTAASATAATPAKARVLGQGDDRDQDGRARRMMRWGVLRRSSRIFQERIASGVRTGRSSSLSTRRAGAATTSHRTTRCSPEPTSTRCTTRCPTMLHAEWSHRALDAGKHVLCEKPLTMSPTESAESLRPRRVGGLTILEAYMWPHHPRARKICSSWPLERLARDRCNRVGRRSATRWT